MALPPQFLDELRARTPLAAIIGRRARLARSGRQWKGCCPFHGEKTPSFYVYDDHYHCFGCGAHGDAITFVMQSMGATFPEAVEQLAAEAGMQVPKPTPEAAAAEQRRLDLAGVLGAAAASFERRLALPEGREARDYLTRRGLTEATIARYGLGWSGEGRGAVAADLVREGVTRDDLVDAGLMRRDDETGRVFDLFFNRVMFPIRDRSGRAISFGGRTLGDGQPKYVNGPETTLFSKRRTLYGLDLAREAVRRGGTLVVVEGYMDVIALGQAGFDAAVAPLGTALTEEQLGEIWRLTPVPVLSFDGDAAGARAAARVAELALPKLTPDRSLRLVTLPAGEDPDSLVRARGAAAFQAFLDGARSLGDSLFDLLREGMPEATPEQRAALRNRLEDAARRIPDRALASEYRRVLLDRFYALRPRSSGRPFSTPNGRRTGRRGEVGFGPALGGRIPPRPPIDPGAVAAERKRVMLAILLNHPRLVTDVEHALAGLDLPPPLARVRDAVTDWVSHAKGLDSQGLLDHLTTLGMREIVDQILAGTPVPLAGCALPGAMPAEAEEGWWEMFGHLNANALHAELDQARDDCARSMTEQAATRLQRLKEAYLRLTAGGSDDPGLAA